MNCIIIEDEIPAQKVLENHVNKIPNLKVDGVFNAAIKANQFLSNNTTDLIFLDINLPDISGMDFISALKDPPLVIITTAYPDYALNSFELDTIVDYLVKPIPFERFYKAITKANRLLQKEEKPDKEEDVIYLNVDKTHHKIVLNNILFIESDRNYITIVTTEKKLTFIDTLKNWAKRLDEDQFTKVHKSFLINIKNVDKLSGNELFVKGYKVPIGRTFKQDLLKKLNIV